MCSPWSIILRCLKWINMIYNAILSQRVTCTSFCWEIMSSPSLRNGTASEKIQSSSCWRVGMIGGHRCRGCRDGRQLLSWLWLWFWLWFWWLLLLLLLLLWSSSSSSSSPSLSPSIVVVVVAVFVVVAVVVMSLSCRCHCRCHCRCRRGGGGGGGGGGVVLVSFLAV